MKRNLVVIHYLKVRVTEFIFLGSKNHCRWWLQAQNWKTLAPWQKSYDKQRWLHYKELMLSNCGAAEILLRVPWTARRPNQLVLKKINPEYSLEELVLKLNLQYFGHLMSQLIGKVSDAQKNWRQEEKGLTEVQMVGWHHQLNGHEFEQALGDGDGQENLMCCRLCGRKELDMTEQLNNNKPKVNCDWLINSFIHFFIQHTCARSWDVKMNWNASALKVLTG